MKIPHEVTFDDGTVERVDAENKDQAKELARNTRIRAFDPGGTKNKADVRSHASVKIRSVAEVGQAILLALAPWAALYALLALDAAFPTSGAVSSHAGVLQLFAAAGTAVPAALTALAAVTGDSLVIPHFPESKKAWLLQLWTDMQIAGTIRVRSAKMHDNVNGMRYDVIASNPAPLMPVGARQPLYSGDTLNVDMLSDATAGNVEFVVLLAYYEELSAQHSRLWSYDQVMAKGEGTITVENTIATVATGIWGGGEAINAEIDQFQARKLYAILGYTTDAECAAIAWRGPDFANVRLGGPGLETDTPLTASWFLDLARAHPTIPLIPVFAADNKAATIIEALQDENGTDATVITTLAPLAA